MLCSFYKLILIVFRTINVNMHLEFRLFNALFNYFNVVERVIRNNAYFSYQSLRVNFYKTREVLF